MGELEENTAQGLISTHFSPFSLCQVAGLRGQCECVFGVGYLPQREHLG